MKVRLCTAQFFNFGIDTTCCDRPELIHLLIAGQIGLVVSCLLVHLLLVISEAAGSVLPEMRTDLIHSYSTPSEKEYK